MVQHVILLLIFNSCINPIVYSLHGVPFSKSLKTLLWCGRPLRKRNLVVPKTAETSQHVERELHDTSYRNEAFVENRIESRSSERSCRSVSAFNISVHFNDFNDFSVTLNAEFSSKNLTDEKLNLT